MGLCRVSRGNDGVGCDVTSIMLKAVELPHMLRGSMLLAGAGRKWGPDCAPEEVIEEGDPRK